MFFPDALYVDTNILLLNKTIDASRLKYDYVDTY